MDSEDIKTTEELMLKGENALNKNDHSSAFRYFGLALKESQSHNDQYGIADAYMHLGHIYFFKNQNQYAKESYAKTFNIAMEIKNYELFASAVNNLLNVHIQNKEYSMAEKIFQKALETYTESDDKIRLAKLKSNYFL